MMATRREGTVTSISWIPSEAVTGLNKGAFESGVTHYDEPPPDEVDDLVALRDADAFRFANHLAVWADFGDDGSVVDAGYTGGCVMGSTTVAVGRRQATFAAVALPELRAEPEVADGTVRFTQTVGGRTALPAPRRVNRPPFVQFKAPTVWTTLSITLGAEGTSAFELVGASPFPRHWVYGPDGRLALKAGLADFKDWYRHSFGTHTPWGDEDSPALVTAVETALERELSGRIMRGGARPVVRTVREGGLLAEQGEEGEELYLVLDGVLSVEVDDQPVAEVGPGAIVGERALLEGGRRTSTLRARTRVRVAVAGRDQIERDELDELSSRHRREELPR